MANVSVPGTTKPITLLALRGRLNVWLRPGGFHHGSNAWRSTEKPNTRLQPHRLPKTDLLGHLQGESIHE
jgi:hypothetical protein